MQRVVTHYEERIGTLQSQDVSERFIPDTRNPYTRVYTRLKLKWDKATWKNYKAEFTKWKKSFYGLDNDTEAWKEEILAETDGFKDFTAVWVSNTSISSRCVDPKLYSRLYCCGCASCWYLYVRSLIQEQTFTYAREVKGGLDVDPVAEETDLQYNKLLN